MELFVLLVLFNIILNLDVSLWDRFSNLMRIRLREFFLRSGIGFKVCDRLVFIFCMIGGFSQLAIGLDLCEGSICCLLQMGWLLDETFESSLPGELRPCTLVDSRKLVLRQHSVFYVLDFASRV